MKFLKGIAAFMTAALAAVYLPVPAEAEETYTYEVLSDGTAEITCADTSLIRAEIPSEIDGITVTALADKCFSGCKSLESVTLPETLTQIGDYAFENCSLLTEITIPASVTELDSFIFEGCESLTSIEVDAANTAYVSDGGVLYTQGMDTLLRYPAAKEDTKYVLPESCTVIDAWAFTDCSNLQYLEMQNVTAIGADAFFCAGSLQTVILSEGLTDLIGASFAYCTNLRKVTLPSTLKTIGDKCFYACVSLPSVSLPENLVSIGEMAFFGCVQLTEMTVPASVTSIGSMAIGYSVDTATNENALLSSFEMKTVSGSTAHAYAKRNNISCTVQTSRTVTVIIVLAVLCLLLILSCCMIVYFQRRKQQQAEAAAKEAERRAAKALRKKNKKK
jgi:hypothetical protein